MTTLVKKPTAVKKLAQATALALALLGAAQAATAVTTSPANLRRTPSATGKVMRVVPRGTLLTVACPASTGGWCRTSVGGRGGYVASSLLRPVSHSAPLSGEFYASCADMRAAKAAPIRLGQAGYRAALDRDHDGWACRLER